MTEEKTTASPSLVVPCPRCGTKVEWTGNPHRPFCSERCRLIDLGKWATEEYAVPGEPVRNPVDEEGG